MAKKKLKSKNKTNRQTKSLKISACYIVKNCADELRTSIESLREYVDEIIVVDTGSTDSTVEVAESFGAKVFYREWDDDFSAPRNLAIENATGDWIIFLDSDEYFSEETKKNLRFVIERVNKFNKNGILIYRVEIDKNRGNQILATNYVMRILKNKLELHYVGKIHEEPCIGKNSLGDVTFAPPNMLVLYHTGYSSSISREKAERNLKLLLEELAETNNPQRIYGYIAECYNGLEDFANAEKFARLDIESADKKQPPMSSSCRIILSILANDFKRLEERKKFAELAVKIFPAMPEFTAELAECFAMFGDFGNAIKTMQAALKKFKNYGELEPTQFDENMAKFAENRIKLWIEKLNRR